MALKFGTIGGMSNDHLLEQIVSRSIGILSKCLSMKFETTSPLAGFELVEVLCGRGVAASLVIVTRVLVKNLESQNFWTFLITFCINLGAIFLYF